VILFLRTSDIAKAVGVHPNTIRFYEAWGLLPPIPRGPSGYRLFTEAHLDQMCLARMALGESWPGRNIRHSAVALEGAYDHLALVQAERAQAESADSRRERGG
jgi:DNA-binding transcriptional MerR regulator